MRTKQSTTFRTLVTLIFAGSISDAGLASASLDVQEVAQFASVPELGASVQADDPDAEEQWWENLRALIDMLCRLIACDQPASSASFDHSIVFVAMKAQIDSFAASGLRQGLSSTDRAQGKIAALTLADEIDRNPGKFDAGLRGDYRAMLDEVILRLQTPSAPAPGAN